VVIFMEEGAIIKHDIKKAPRTGDWRYMKPEVDREKCIGCTTCVPFCPEASIVVERETWNAKRGARNVERKTGSTIRDTRYATIDYDYCKGCGVCADVCPVKAITMKKN
jgi:pyruvate ferredoxin oxidoreductase delta subunit